MPGEMTLTRERPVRADIARFVCRPADWATIGTRPARRRDAAEGAGLCSLERVKTQRTAYIAYLFAAAAVIVTAAAWVALVDPAERPPSLPFLIPVMIAALIGGFGPGLAATGVATVLLAVPPVGGFAEPLSVQGILWHLLFVGEGALASWLISSRPKAVYALGLAERGRVEEALRRSEERYRAIVDTQSEMVCRFRPDGEILFVNGGYARACGTVPEALVGQNLWKFIPDEDRPSVQAMLDRLTPESPEVRIENRFETAEGIRHTLWTNRALAFDEQGRWTEAQSTGIDMTDRKEAEEALRDANRRQTEFLAVLGHELRNPLAPLSAGLELLRHDRGIESVENVRAMMHRQLEHLTRLVEDLLDLSRISRGEIALRKMPIDLRQVVHDAIELTRPAIGERNHRLVIDVGPKPLTVEGDFQRLTQVVANLLSNAARYTDSEGTIEIVAEADGTEAVLRVRDNGFGFPSERVDTLFDMFIQVPEHRERTGGGGLGIGLALSRQLVEQHGGVISAHSEGPGRGSEFTVRLPLCDVEPVDVAPPTAMRSADFDGAVPRRILVVDDNIDAAESLRLVLEFEGHTVHVEHDGKRAVEAVAWFQPNVVLLDIGMPEMDGYEVARRIRAGAGGGDKLLVAITGWGQSSDRERALEAGFDAHLAKPVDWDALTALIESDTSAVRG